MKMLIGTTGTRWMLLLIIALIVIFTHAPNLPAQVAGDSVRVTVYPPPQSATADFLGDATGSQWTYGHVISATGNTLTLRRVTDTVAFAFSNVRRLDRFEKIRPSTIMGASLVIGAGAGILAAYANPHTETSGGGCTIYFTGNVQHSQCTHSTETQTYPHVTQYAVAGAALGSLMGLGIVAIGPGKWAIVISR